MSDYHKGPMYDVDERGYAVRRHVADYRLTPQAEEYLAARDRGETPGGGYVARENGQRGGEATKRLRLKHGNRRNFLKKP